MALSETQNRLLVDLVEAERHVPEDKRQHFLAFSNISALGLQLLHPGWKHDDRRVFEGDLEALRDAGLISVVGASQGTRQIYVKENGFEHCNKLAVARGEPMKRVQSLPLTYLDSGTFQRKYPKPYAKWSQAEALLWTGDSSETLTTIGHLTREAMQEFAGVLAQRLALQNIEQDPTKTVSRVRSVLNAVAPRLGVTERAFLDALLAYWGTVIDLVQRQEHGALRE